MFLHKMNHLQSSAATTISQQRLRQQTRNNGIPGNNISSGQSVVSAARRSIAASSHMGASAAGSMINENIQHLHRIRPITRDDLEQQDALRKKRIEVYAQHTNFWNEVKQEQKVLYEKIKAKLTATIESVIARTVRLEEPLDASIYPKDISNLLRRDVTFTFPINGNGHIDDTGKIEFHPLAVCPPGAEDFFRSPDKYCQGLDIPNLQTCSLEQVAQVILPSEKISDPDAFQDKRGKTLRRTKGNLKNVFLSKVAVLNEYNPTYVPIGVRLVKRKQTKGGGTSDPLPETQRAMVNPDGPVCNMHYSMPPSMRGSTSYILKLAPVIFHSTEACLGKLARDHPDLIAERTSIMQGLRKFVNDFYLVPVEHVISKYTQEHWADWTGWLSDMDKKLSSDELGIEHLTDEKGRPLQFYRMTVRDVDAVVEAIINDIKLQIPIISLQELDVQLIVNLPNYITTWSDKKALKKMVQKEVNPGVFAPVSVSITLGFFYAFRERLDGYSSTSTAGNTMSDMELYLQQFSGNATETVDDEDFDDAGY